MKLAKVFTFTVNRSCVEITADAPIVLWFLRKEATFATISSFCGGFPALSFFLRGEGPGEFKIHIALVATIFMNTTAVIGLCIRGFD